MASKQKVLYLLRHAKSSWSSNAPSDWHRPLNKRGNNSLITMAKKLTKHQVYPEQIKTSDAKRTEQTSLKLSTLMQIPLTRIEFSPDLYHASAQTMLTIIKNSANTINQLMLVAHNPGMTELSHYLTDLPIDNLPTCACVGIGFSCQNWRDITKNNARLLFVDYPKKQD